MFLLFWSRLVQMSQSGSLQRWMRPGAMLYYTVLYYVTLYYTTLCYNLLLYNIITLYYTITHYTTLYYTLRRSVHYAHRPPSQPKSPIVKAAPKEF